jgi:hypothetical protein
MGVRARGLAGSGSTVDGADELPEVPWVVVDELGCLRGRRFDDVLQWRFADDDNEMGGVTFVLEYAVIRTVLLPYYGHHNECGGRAGEHGAGNAHRHRLMQLESTADEGDGGGTTAKGWHVQPPGGLLTCK